MASYRARATAIYRFVVQLRREMEQQIDATPGDKTVLISFAVEAVNKLLYCFMLSQEMFDQIDKRLNDHLGISPEPHPISMLYLQVLEVVRELEEHARSWVIKYS